MPGGEEVVEPRDVIDAERGRGGRVDVRGIGQWREFDTGRRKIKAMATLHPAYLLRQPDGIETGGSENGNAPKEQKPAGPDKPIAPATPANAASPAGT